MQVKKIYIENFKGIRERRIIDFSDHRVTLFTGPNGFGKTTIYDVLELCLTNSLYRITEEQSVSRVIDKRNKCTKPFYQNTEGLPTVLKVLLEKGNGDQLTIIQYDEGKNRNVKPAEHYFRRYKATESHDFENTFVPEHVEILNETELNIFLEIKNSISLSRLFKLFNYLQQNENTYFLKKSKYNRKEEMDFLFQTTDEKHTQESIERHLSFLERIYRRLDEKVKLLDLQKEQSEHLVYKRLFEKEVRLDLEDVFSTFKSIASLENAFSTHANDLDELNEFVSIFSPKDFFKKIERQKLEKLAQNESFLQSYVLQNFLEDKKFEEIRIQKKFIDNDTLLKNYLLQNHISKYNFYISQNQKINDIKKFLSESFENKVHSFINLIESLASDYVFDEQDEAKFKTLVFEKQQLEESASNVGKIIAEVISFRDQLSTKYLKFTHDVKQDNSCPYCGYDWESYEQLLVHFDEREANLKKLDSETTDKIESVKKSIEDDYILPFERWATDYLKLNGSYNTEILGVIKEFTLSNKGGEVLSKINNNVNFAPWNELKSVEELNKDLKELKLQLSAKYRITNFIYDLLTRLKGELHLSNSELLNSYSDKVDFTPFVLSELPTNEMLIRYVNNLKSKFEDIHHSIVYDAQKSQDTNKFFEKYFGCKTELFERIGNKLILEKRDYLTQKYHQRKVELSSVLMKRRRGLKKVISKLIKLKDVYTAEIKAFKSNMVTKIQIPFFLYTAKVLQNYQQGMGVFIDTKEGSDAIRFYTDASTNHDAMHHLSSGQLAVVSIAFLLAVNKVYQISKELNFLAIDDPIQEMDTLNIHSFIELVRHEFLNDYQLIMSTHEDTSALYMKYKFEKLKPNSVKLINVQREFFDTVIADN